MAPYWLLHVLALRALSLGTDLTSAPQSSSLVRGEPLNHDLSRLAGLRCSPAVREPTCKHRCWGFDLKIVVVVVVVLYKGAPSSVEGKAGPGSWMWTNETPTRVKVGSTTNCWVEVIPYQRRLVVCTTVWAWNAVAGRGCLGSVLCSADDRFLAKQRWHAGTRILA